jgi:hypothetical protein
MTVEHARLYAEMVAEKTMVQRCFLLFPTLWCVATRSPWFWVMLVAMVMAILSFIPLGDSIRVFWEVVGAVARSAGITALITLSIRLSRQRQDAEKSAQL